MTDLKVIRDAFKNQLAEVSVVVEQGNAGRESWKCTIADSESHAKISVDSDSKFSARSSLSNLGRSYLDIERAAHMAVQYVRLVRLTLDDTVVSRKLTAEILARLSSYSAIEVRDRGGVAIVWCEEDGHAVELFGCDDGGINWRIYLQSEMVSSIGLPSLELAMTCSDEWLRNHRNPIPTK